MGCEGARTGRAGAGALRRRLARLEARPGLSGTTRRLIAVSALALLGRTDDLREALAFALDRRTSADLLREAILVTHLFAGYPRAIHAFEVLSGVLSERGVASPPVREFPSGDGPGREWLHRRGEGLFAAIYREHAGKVRERISGFHPEFMEWILADAYGKVLARPHLSLKAKELIAVALLTVLGLPRQKTAHLRGARRAGATAREVAEAIRTLAPMLPAATIRAALTEAGR